MNIIPYACMNDGLFDMVWTADPFVNSLLGVAGMFDKAKNGGTHVYDPAFSFTRGKSLKMSYKGRVDNKPATSEQIICVDGEKMTYKEFVKMDVLPEELEYLFDAKKYFTEFKSFI